jgi:hypothetical protein
MRASDVDTSMPSGPIDSLPWQLTQLPSRSTLLLTLGVALPAAVVVLVPLCLLANHVAFHANLSTIVENRIAPTLLVAFAFVTWILLFGWPIARQMKAIGRRRQINLSLGLVTVTERRVLGATTWSQPMSAYLGIAHHVRTSLSGTRHEIILVHPDANRSLLLQVGPKLTQSDMDAVTNLLSCREIAHRRVYAPTSARKRGAHSELSDFAAGQFAAVN